MNPNNGNETIDKALVVGLAALIVWESGPVLAVAAATGAAFCTGRWLVKRLREGGCPWA